MGGSAFFRAHGAVSPTSWTARLALILALAGSTACEEDPGVIRLRVAGAFEPSALDYGEVPVGMTRSQAVIFRNIGTPVLLIDAVELPPDFALRGIKGRLEGTELVPGAEIGFEVVFVPTQPQEYTGNLVIKSGTTDILLPLHGFGVQRDVPLLALEPAALDFGSVALSTQARRPFVVRNTGTAQATLNRVTLRSSGAVATATDPFAISTALPVIVPINGTATLEAIFAPTVEGGLSDILVIEASGEHAPLELSVRGTGLRPLGDILCSPSSVAFGQVERGQVGRRDVTCSAQGGPARLISATTSGSPMFTLPAPPSTIDLADGQAVTITVEFRADGLPGTIQGDLVLSYTGGSGAGTRRVSLVGEVIPPPPTATAMTVVLRWDRNNTDVDLHLVRPGGNFYDANGADCHWREDNPDWGAAGVTTDNPFLDVDDTDGIGPETINLESAAAGNYTVYVHFYGSFLPIPVDADLEIYIAGTRVATPSRSNMQCNQVWRAGEIQWNGTTGTFVPSNTITTSSEGACF
jgi:hypothetical protein